MTSEVALEDTCDEYKRVQLGPQEITLPEEWEIYPVTELFEIEKNSFDPSELDSGSEVMLYSMPAYDSNQEPILTLASEVGSKKYRVPEDTILFPKLNIRKRRFWRVEQDHSLPAVCSTEFWPLLPRRSLELDFYHYYFDSYEFTSNPKVTSASSTNSHKRVKQSSFEKLQLPVPPLPEQRHIADILSTVDEQIQQTDEIIQETKELKRGLMQDLYTRGTEHDREMQSTRIGKIPVNWDLTTIDQYAEVISGTHVKSALVSDDDSLTPYITGPSDFTRTGIQVSKYTDSPSSFCKKGDTLVTVKGMSCGKSTFADSSVSITTKSDQTWNRFG